MQRLLLLLIAGGALVFGPGCRQQDLRAMNIVLTGVSSETDVKAVSNAVGKLDGVFADSIVFHGTVSMEVRYDSMKLARKNIEYAVAGAGFGANDIPAGAGPGEDARPRP